MLRSKRYINGLFILPALCLAIAGLPETARADSGCAEMAPVLEQPSKWLRGTLKQQHERLMLTYQAFTCGKDEKEQADINGKARQMRATIIKSMIEDHEGQAEAEEVVKYLVHYINVDNRGDVNNPNRADDWRPHWKTNGFIPVSMQQKAEDFIKAQAGKISRQGLAKVIAFDSIQGAEGIGRLKIKYGYTPYLDARIEAEKDPMFAAEILRAMDDNTPAGRHAAFETVEEKIKGMSPEAILSLFKNPPQVFRDADFEREKGHGKNTAILDNIRKKMLAELAKHTANNAEAQEYVLRGIENFLPDTAEAASKPLDAELKKMIDGFGKHGPILHFPKFFRSIIERRFPHQATVTELFETLEERSTDDLLLLQPAKVEVEFKDHALRTIAARTKQEGFEKLGRGLVDYYRTLEDETHVNKELLDSVTDYAKEASAADLIKLMTAAKNAPVFATILDASKDFGADKKRQLFAAIAEFEENPAKEEYNRLLGFWKQAALNFVFGRNAGSDQERRDLVYKIVGSLEDARSEALVFTRGLALRQLADMMKEKPLPSDAGYRKLLERLVYGDAESIREVASHEQAIEAYRLAMRGDEGRKQARAVITSALKKSLDTGPRGQERALRLYAGLRTFGDPQGDEVAVLERGKKSARELLQAQNRKPESGLALAAASALIDADATEFDAEIGLAYFNMLRYMSPAHPKLVLQEHMRLIAKACLGEGVADKFHHLRHLCGYAGGPEIRRMTFNLAVNMLAPLVSAGRDPEIASQARQLISMIEDKSEEIEKKLGVPGPVLGQGPQQQQQLLQPPLVGNLQTIVCPKLADGKWVFEPAQIASSASDSDKAKFCQDRLGQVPAPQAPVQGATAPKPDPVDSGVKALQPPALEGDPGVSAFGG